MEFVVVYIIAQVMQSGSPYLDDYSTFGNLYAKYTGKGYYLQYPKELFTALN